MEHRRCLIHCFILVFKIIQFPDFLYLSLCSLFISNIICAFSPYSAFPGVPLVSQCQLLVLLIGFTFSLVINFCFYFYYLFLQLCVHYSKLHGIIIQIFYNLLSYQTFLLSSLNYSIFFPLENSCHVVPVHLILPELQPYGWYQENKVLSSRGLPTPYTQRWFRNGHIV